MVFVMHYTNKVESIFKKTSEELVEDGEVDVLGHFLVPLYTTSRAAAKDKCDQLCTKGEVFGPSGRGGV